MKAVISFLVSAYNRPEQLRICLACLVIQKGLHEIIVCDNGPDPRAERLADSFGVVYADTSKGEDCRTGYHGLEREPIGEWLCFPTEDSYYVPTFAETMLEAAARHGWDFVYSDCVYDPRLTLARRQTPAYSVLETRPEPGQIDKTTFLVRRSAFECVGGWPQHPLDWRDGALAERLVRAGVPHGKAPGLNVVHN